LWGSIRSGIRLEPFREAGLRNGGSFGEPGEVRERWEAVAGENGFAPGFVAVPAGSWFGPVRAMATPPTASAPTVMATRIVRRRRAAKRDLPAGGALVIPTLIPRHRPPDAGSSRLLIVFS
jgi:hypothetical protein